MKKQLLGALALAIPFAANADVIGATFSAYSWNQGWSGDLQSDQAGDTPVDFEDDLGFDDERGNSFSVALEHPIPILPNIRLAKTDMEIDETNNITRDFTYEGDPYTAGDTVDSDVDLSHTDVTLYYEILDNIVSVDLGLTARIFDGDATISARNSGETGTTDIDGTIPLLYVGARADLPLTGLYAAGEVHGLGAGGNSIIDAKASVGYEIGIVAFELGLRDFSIDVEGDDDEEFDLTVDGAFLGVVIDI